MISNARISMIVLSTLALSLALTRCAPLSVSQSRLNTKAGGGSPANPNTVAQVGETEAQVRTVTSTPASVRDAASLAYETEIKALPALQSLTITAENDKEELEAFKLSRTLTFQLKNFAPEECKAFLGVNLRDQDINLGRWNVEGHQITTDCTALPDGHWKVSVSANVSAEAWKPIAANLVSITIFVANDPKIKLAGPSKKL